jgi:hypothetical protein
MTCNCVALHTHAAQRYDPTRTTILRRRFEGEAARRFRWLKGRINEAVIAQDGFGLKTNRGEFDFPRSAEKVSAFMDWLQSQVNAGLLEVRQGEPLSRAAERAWSSVYVRSAYQRGMAQSAAKLRAEGVDVAPEWITEAFTRPFHVDRVGLAYTRTFEDLIGITKAMSTQISRELASGLAEGKGPMEIARRMNNRVDKIGITRARMLARTECLTGDMIVDGADVQSAHKRWYDGEIIEIVTADGRNVTATPNHPMLTQRGWVFAGQVTNTDYLICNALAEVSGSARDKHIDHAPSSIAQVFDATAAIGVIERKRTGKPDFHGDGVKGYVNIASAARELRVGLFSPVFEHSFDFILTKADWPGTRFCHFSGRLLPVDEAVDFVSAALDRVGLFQSVGYGFAADAKALCECGNRFTGVISGFDFIDRQALDKCRCNPSVAILGLQGIAAISHHAGAADLILNPSDRVSREIGNLVARGAVYIHSNDSIAVPSGSGFAIIGSADAFLSVADFPSFPQSACHGGRRKTNALSDSSSGQSATVKADRVVQINRRRFSGHVYNLSTRDGYFTIQGGVYTGNTIRAHAEASLNSYEEAGVMGVGVEAEWRTAQDNAVCEECEEAARSGPYTLQQARGMIPLHPNCLPGDSLVLARSGVTAASKRWFKGDMIIITTASGRKLTCTPNHPILSDTGWQAAKSINFGDNVISDGFRDGPAFGGGDDKHVPTPIHEIAEAFGRSGGVVSRPVPVTAPDFHGDGMNGDVAQVWTDRSLRREFHASIFQKAAQLGLVMADVVAGLRAGLRTLDQFIVTGLSTPNCVVGSGDLGGSVTGGHAGPFDGLRFGLGTQLDASFQEPFVDGAAADAKLARKIIAGATGPVFSDQVINVDVQSFIGHVYNLESGNHSYIAQGIVNHNCRCAWLPQVINPRDVRLR